MGIIRRMNHELDGEAGLQQQIDGLRDELATLRQELAALTNRADASADRADASEAREALAQGRADASEAREAIAQGRADAGEAREEQVRRRVEAIESLAAEDRLRIDDLEAHVDIDREMILELHREGVLQDDQVEQLQAALRSSRVIGAAIGIVMSTRVVTQEEAFTVLQQASSRTNRKLREIAEELVMTGDTGALA
ncbi:hypothetical protein GCM10022236_35240 [Microlunatus ginsengisoli]|uniref:ANTAR domain-containing protein n=2 Tax=Microlunatus ginsengisoli TaxID=363863 RepID=A0ABP7ACX9_9ACTN